MDHKLATIVGAAAVLAVAPATAQTAQFDGPAIPVASSHADLLQPIPNATERLKIADSEAAARPPVLEQIQYGAPVDHHHHHHHHSHDWYVRNGYKWFGGRWVTGAYYAHHHHHHHHHDDDH